MALVAPSEKFMSASRRIFLCLVRCAFIPAAPARLAPLPQVPRAARGRAARLGRVTREPRRDPPARHYTSSAWRPLRRRRTAGGPSGAETSERLAIRRGDTSPSLGALLRCGELAAQSPCAPSSTRCTCAPHSAPATAGGQGCKRVPASRACKVEAALGTPCASHAPPSPSLQRDAVAACSPPLARGARTRRCAAAHPAVQRRIRGWTPCHAAPAPPQRDAARSQDLRCCRTFSRA